MDTLIHMFSGIEEYPNLVQEVYISSDCDVDEAAARLIVMGFQMNAKPVEVLEKSYTRPASPQPRPLQPAQACQPFHPSPIPVSAPIPIPSATKRSSTNLNSSPIYAPPPYTSFRSDAQKMVGNLKFVGECIKKNCKKTLKELMNCDKTTEGQAYLEENKRDDDDSMTISVSEAIRKEFEEIETERRILEDQKRKFEEDKSRFHDDVMRFNAYVQTEYQRLISSQQHWMDEMSSRYSSRRPRYFQDTQSRFDVNHDTMDPRGAMRAGAGYEDGEYAWEDNKGNKERTARRARTQAVVDTTPQVEGSSTTQAMDLPDEIKYLQQSTIDKHSDVRANDSGDSDSDRDDIPHTDHPEQLLAEPPPIRNAGNTGVKGVLADYAEAKENLRLRNQMEKAETIRKIEKMAITVGSSRAESRGEVEEEEMDDEEFMRMYRQKRLAEMQQAQRPTFGYLRGIDSSEYVDAIEKEIKDVFVIVHLYKNEFKACVKLNLILQNLAIKYPFIKFMKIVSTEALPKYDDVGLPTLLVYQAGGLVHRWVPITSKIGNNFDSEDVELLLAKNKVIKTALIDKTTMLHKEKSKDFMQELDDDDDISDDDD